MSETDTNTPTQDDAQNGVPPRTPSGGLTEDIRGVMADIERRLDRLKTAHADREREREELEHRSAEVESQAERLAEAQSELEFGRRAHEEALQAAEARFAELDRREAQAREAFEQAKARHDAAREELAADKDKIEHERAQLDESKQAFEAERVRVRELAEEASQQLKDIEEDRTALEDTARELDERQKDLDAQASTMAERSKELDQQRDALEQRANELQEQDRKLAELSRQAAEQREQLSGDSSDLEQQKRWLAEQTKQADLLRARVAQLEGELAGAREAAEQATAVPAASPEADEAPAEELVQTRDKLHEAAGIIGQLRQQLDEVRAGNDVQTDVQMVPADDAHLDRRRRRLAYVRSTLRDEKAKVAKASELIRQRNEALAARGRAGAVEQAEPAKQTKTGPVAAMARLGVGMACVAVALAVLAGVSWLAAGEIATPTYTATVTVAHDARGREVIAEDLAGWQGFHEQLMTDPRFFEFAAERMRQRGLLGLGDAVAVRAFVEESVSWMSGQDGQLKLEIRQEGAGRAERVAETLAIALVGQANAARERRPDGLPSVISQEATADARPLTNERPMYAGGIMVGLTLLSAGLGGLVSRRLGRLRQQVAAEGATAVDDMGDHHESRISIG